jgi:uncharacterized membrane protein YkvA (DUF1232 family)
MKILARIVDWLAFPYGMFLMLKDHSIPVKVKIKAGIIIGILFLYILVPVDLIPDVIPALGWLEDLLFIPVAMAVTAKIIPEINIPGLIRKTRSDIRRVVFWTIFIFVSMTLIAIASFAMLIFLLVRYCT